jgi:uncharacterized protein (TIGR03086 family)
MDPAELHRRAVESWQSRVESVPEDAWDRATPCPDWDVRALVNHVVGEELWTRPLVDGRTIEEVGSRFDGDVLADDPVGIGRGAAAEAVAAVEERLPEGVTVHLSFGDVPLEEYVRQLVADHLVHGWDLAAATGQDRRLDPALVDEVAAWFADREALYRSSGAVGERPDVGDDAQSQLLAAFGRDPSW